MGFSGFGLPLIIYANESAAAKGDRARSGAPNQTFAIPVRRISFSVNPSIRHIGLSIKCFIL